MLACGGARISHKNYELGFCSCRIFQLSSLIVKPPSILSSYPCSTVFAIVNYRQNRLQQSSVSSSSSSNVQSKCTGDNPIVSDSFSQVEEDHEHPSEVLSPVAGGIVALGKFDALHIGHRELAIQASKVGTPYLLSFVGMAEVFGWEPRAPIVAKCDRKRVLSSWAPYCNNIIPREIQLQFSSVRHLTPRQFVEKLASELRVDGVVAGENYRFGYKAAADASELVRLCDEFGMGAYIINSVMDKHQDARNLVHCDLKERGQVSSTRVRHALAEGDMKYVSELLGRQHRLFLAVKDLESLTSTSSKDRLSIPKSCLLNLPPKDGIYENCLLLVGDNPVKCKVSIGTTHVHVVVDEVASYDLFYSKNVKVLGIEFGEFGVNFL